MGDRRSRSDAPEPQYSRLFIVCSRDTTADDFYNSFDKFGTIEDVRLVRDRNTGENKGIAYVKFSKTSEAAKALQEMNGRCVGSSSRPLKVLVANSRDEGSTRDSNEGEKYIRLFVAIPRSMNEDDVENKFKEYGKIVKINVLRDRDTKQSKGFAYITYSSFIEAALAYENCERSYKAVFAEPKPVVKRDRSFDKAYDSRRDNYGSNDYYPPSKGSRNEPPGQLIVTASPCSNQDQIWRLFDLIPGLDYCQPINSNNLYSVVYNTMRSAQLARDKLHGFEYPPGYRLIVRFDSDAGMDPSRYSQRSILKRDTNERPDLTQLAETIAQATSLIQAAGLNVNPASLLSKCADDDFIESQCSVKLPPPQPLTSINTPHAKRCFIVCSPNPPPMFVMRDVFCRFGNLIDVYVLQRKNVGYAKYASVESANEAIKTLHGAEVAGVRLKVLEADERRDRFKRRGSTPPPDDDKDGY
uniref:Putative rna-binding protein 45 n=1 Tax=Xenopsylla cheopis TaxID=163159 RepID=A0A6M2DND7_XENCH